MEYTFHKSLGRITQQVSKGLGRVLENKFRKSGYKITAAQWSVISYLHYNNLATQKEIGRFLGVNKVMVKRIIDQLQNDGFVNRLPSATDKRYNQIQLTKKGDVIYQELVPYAEETLMEAYDGINNEEIEHCLLTLNKVSDKLEKMGDNDK